MDPQQMLEKEKERCFSVDNFSRETIDAMAMRCEQDGHSPQGCCTAAFQVYHRCRWCGARTS